MLRTPLSHKKRGNHEENRYKLCLLCLKKFKKWCEIKGCLKEKLLEICSDYNPSDERIPAVLCNFCKINVYKCYKNKNKIKVPDLYSEFAPLPKTTRQSENITCVCKLCEMVGYNSVPNFCLNNDKRKNKKIKKCTCISDASGKHKCSTNVLLQNVKQKIDAECNVKDKEKLVSSLLKDIVKENNASETGEQKEIKNQITLSQFHGKPLKVEIKPKEVPSSQISVDSLYKLQNKMNCSDNTLINKIVPEIRKGNNYKIIEPKLKSKLMEKNKKLDSFFEERDFSFVHIQGNNVTPMRETAIICNNLRAFLAYICQEREQSLDELHLKFGIDGGGSFLKLCLSMQIKDDDLQNINLKTNHVAKKFKSSGVKRIFILGLAHKVQENYENVNILWEALSISEFLGTIATDLKLANILTGLMSHSSSYPCTWCDSHSDQLHLCGNSRTIGSCIKNCQEWVSKGKNKKQAKDHKNCINLPVFSMLDPCKEIIEIIPPPELHLLLGGVNTIFNKMLIDFESVSLEWAKICNVERSFTHGSLSFEGNQCKKLIDNVDKLRAICGIDSLKFVKAFESLKKVVDSCFSSKLKDTFEKDIEEFKKYYGDLDVKVTPKVHAIFYHVTQFCKKSNRGLAFFSEQAVESLHHDFGTVWNRYKVLKSNPEFSKQLLKSVLKYNCLHI